ATIAYEVLAGAAPFESWAPQERANAQVRAEPPPASSRNRWLDPATDAVLLRGLAKDPSERWQTCVEMVDAIEAALAGRGATAPQPAARAWPAPAPPTPGPPTPAPAARRRWPWVVGIGALVLAAAALAFWRLTQQVSPTVDL